MENVISDADYKFLKAQLKADGYDEWYFIVWFMAATGARVSELLHIKAEHIQSGILTIQQGRKDTPFVYPEELEHGGCEMAQRNRTYFRLHLSESVWTAHYYSWNSFSTQTFLLKNTG